MLKEAELAERPDFRVGPLQLSPSRRRVEGPSGSANLEPVVMKILLLLVDDRGQVVTRNDLFEQAWGETMVGDDSLNRAIGRIRTALQSAIEGEFELETIPRTGYRLTIAGSETRPSSAASSPALSRRTLVGAGLFATVALAGGAIWWTRRPSVPNPAVEKAKSVLDNRSPGAAKQALAMMQAETRRNPGDASAWGLLSYVMVAGDDEYFAKTQQGESASEIRSAIDKARAIDPDEPNAMLAEMLLRRSLRDWIETDQSLHRVVAIDPRNTFAMGRLVSLYQASGYLKESWDWNEKLLSINPQNPNAMMRRAQKQWIFGRVAEADGTADSTLLRWPGYPAAWHARLLIYAMTDRTEAARRMVFSADRPPAINHDIQQLWDVALTALATRKPEDIAAARTAILAGASHYSNMAAVGTMVLSQLGELDAAFEAADGFLLAKGGALGAKTTNDNNLATTSAWTMTQWLFTPPTKAMRADPRFIALAKGTGLYDYWRWRKTMPDQFPFSP